MSSDESGDVVEVSRSVARRYVAMLVIGAATAQALGVAIKSPTQLEANDISRWCTVWSLVENGNSIRNRRRLPLAGPHPGQGAARPDKIIVTRSSGRS